LEDGFLQAAARDVGADPSGAHRHNLDGREVCARGLGGVRERTGVVHLRLNKDRKGRPTSTGARRFTNTQERNKKNSRRTKP